MFTMRRRLLAGECARPPYSRILFGNNPRVGFAARWLSTDPPKSCPAPNPKPSLLQRAKGVAAHYWHGSKLLAYETKISSRLLLKVLRGEKLIRREYLQLIRTTGDLFRLVPFIIIAIIPFLEFALPVLLKFFPNMLPSTFEDKLQAEEKLKKRIKAKLEMAKFLQNIGRSLNAESSKKVDTLKGLIERARSQNSKLNTQEIVAVCSNIGDDVTLGSLGRPQLVGLCKYMNITAFGTDGVLRYQLRKALERIKADDEMIIKEGVDSLNYVELRNACLERGIRISHVSEERMREQLAQWVNLHTEHRIPGPLLMLSYAFAMSDNIEVGDALLTTVQSLPDPVITDAQTRLEKSSSDEIVDPLQKLEALTRQEALIKQELAQQPKLAVREAQVNGKALEETVQSISETVTMLATKNPATSERNDLHCLQKDLENLEIDTFNDPSVSKMGEQVGKLLDDIDRDIKAYENELLKRIESIDASKDGTINPEQLAQILQLIRESPHDGKRVKEIIDKYDKSGSGKVFIRDIASFADRKN